MCTKSRLSLLLLEPLDVEALETVSAMHLQWSSLDPVSWSTGLCQSCSWCIFALFIWTEAICGLWTGRKRIPQLSVTFQRINGCQHLLSLMFNQMTAFIIIDTVVEGFRLDLKWDHLKKRTSIWRPFCLCPWLEGTRLIYLRSSCGWFDSSVESCSMIIIFFCLALWHAIHALHLARHQTES